MEGAANSVEAKAVFRMQARGISAFPAGAPWLGCFLMGPPPFDCLYLVSSHLSASGIEHALGGSGLMHALGLEERVCDWDITTDAPPETVHAALRDLAPTLHGNSGIHADHKVVCFEGAVEVICRFAFFAPGGLVRIPTIVTGMWRGIPLGSPEAWAVAYLLMREEKPGRGRARCVHRPEQ
jgi:hypothetical protein